jgi:hypothetical protein
VEVGPGAVPGHRVVALMITSSIWHGSAKLVRCEAHNLTDLIAKIATACSIPDAEERISDTDATTAPVSQQLQLILNGDVITELASIPDRARVEIRRAL